MVVRVVVRYSLRPDLTWWTIGQGDDVLYAGPEYLPYPFEQWETNFVNATAGAYKFDIHFGGGEVNYGASFEIWYGALHSPSHHVLLAHGNHTRFVDEVETSGERIVADFILPADNSSSFGIITGPSNDASTTADFILPADNSSSFGIITGPSNDASTTATATTSTTTSSTSPTIITMSAEYSATVPTYNCFCVEDGSSACLQALCHAADKSQDMCLELACSWQE
jgi:hypothetical protein